MSEQTIAFLASSAYAVLMAIATALSRAGIWSSWMDPDSADYVDERMVLMFLPLSGICGLGVALMTVPIENPAHHLLEAIGAVLFCVALFLIMPVTVFRHRPAPRWVYPKWARDMRERYNRSRFLP